jgi:hypothetical protein
MGERIGRIGQIETDFFQNFILNLSQNPKIILKKICFNPPNPPNPFSHRITNVSQVLHFLEIHSFLIQIIKKFK